MNNSLAQIGKILRESVNYMTNIPKLIACTTLLAGCVTAPSTPKAPQSTPVTVGGVMFADANNNELFDRGELPIRNRAVFAVSETGQEITKTTTDSKGAFVLSNFPPDVHSVRIETTSTWPSPKGSTERSSNLQRWGTTVMVGETILLGIPNPQDCSAAKQRETCRTWLLPDLEPKLHAETFDAEIEYPGLTNWYTDTTTSPGRRLLRFGTFALNKGGPLHVIGLAPENKTRQPVIQRIYGPSGQFKDRRAGTFDYHPTHHHIHLGRFEQYRLRNIDGTTAAGGQKVSFCLTNVIQFSPKSSLSPKSERTLRLPLSTMECGSKEQGINQGWADYYGPSLPDQWIDITNVLPGEYQIEVVVDPDNEILESDETNNKAVLAITLPRLPTKR
jgi:hypothetical protein